MQGGAGRDPAASYARRFTRAGNDADEAEWAAPTLPGRRNGELQALPLSGDGPPKARHIVPSLTLSGHPEPLSQLCGDEAPQGSATALLLMSRRLEQGWFNAYYSFAFSARCGLALFVPACMEATARWSIAWHRRAMCLPTSDLAA